MSRRELILSSRDVEEHPDRPHGGVAVHVPIATLRALSRIDVPRALTTVALDWLVIATAITLALRLDHVAVTILAILVIGGRQHALAVIVHDAVHHRFLPDRRLNDWVAELLVAWPIFLSVRAFRTVHGPHHRFTGEAGDGNRRAWRTHRPDGRLTAEWTYPKTPLGLARTLLRRAAVLTGVFWIIRGLVAPFVLRRPPLELLARTAYFVLAAWILTRHAWWHEALVLWLLPYCTWHMAAQYARLVCEHSGSIAEHPAFARTRTTMPGPLGRFFVLPHHIGYHIEHHWYPSVPWYNLPRLHRALRRDATFREHANVQRSVLASLRQCTHARATG
jgi:fatty acid desaturase